MKYSIRNFIPVFLFCLYALQAKGQQPCTATLVGWVIDEESGAGVPNVPVYLKELQLELHTDSTGSFQFQQLCPKKYTLHFAMPGAKHQTRAVEVPQTQPLKVVFALPQGSAVVVRQKRASYSSSMPTAELSGATLESTRGQSLAEMTKGLPGVNAVQTGPTIFKPMIQGLYGSRILIFNNGVRQEDQQWGNEHAPAVDPYTAGSIKVIRGAYALRYGPDAVGGVILVDAPPMPSDTGLHGSIHTAGYSNNRGGAIAGMFDYTHPKLRGFAFRAQGSARGAGDASAPNYVLSNTGFNDYNFSTTATYKHKRWSIGVYYSLFNTKVGVLAASHIGNLTDLENAINSSTPRIVRDFTYQINRPYQRIQHELMRGWATWDLAHVGKLTIDVSRQYNLRNEFDAHRAYNDSLASLNKPQLHFELTTWTANAGLDGIKVGNFKLSTGLQYIYQKNTYEGRYFIPNFYSHTLGGYLIASWRKARWNAEAGLRYDWRYLKAYYYQNNKFYSPDRTFANPSTSVGLTYDWSAVLRQKFTVATAFRTPTVSELYSRGLHHGVAAVENGDSTLSPEYALNISTQWQVKKKRWAAELTLYYNHIAGYIYAKPVQPPTLTVQGAFPTFDYTQTNAQFTGIDLALNDTLLKGIVFQSRFSYVSAFDVKNEAFLVMIPPFRWDNSLRYLLPNFGKLSGNYVGAGLLWVGQQGRVEPNSDYLPPPPAYLLASAMLGTKVKLGPNNLDLSLVVTNLFNTSYRDYLNRFRYYADEMGRNIIFRAGYFF